MNTKNDVEVIINGKQYTISGYESSDYLQRIATHINDKYAEFKQDEGYSRLDAEMRNILLAINLSDDYYKAQQSIQELQKEKEDLEKEIFNMKHDMIEMKAQIDAKEKKVKELKKVKTESEHEVIRLETELKNAKTEGENHTEGSVLPEQNELTESAAASEESVIDTEEDNEQPKDAEQADQDSSVGTGETGLESVSIPESSPAADTNENAASENRNVPKKYSSSKNNRRGRRR